MAFDNNDLLELRRKVDLRLIAAESYTPKSTTGKAYKFHCPFHDDRKHPNLSVYVDGYYCRACGADGSVFHWLQHVHKITFAEAVKRVQEMSGHRIDGGSRSQLRAESYRIIGMDPSEMRKLEGTEEWLHMIDDVTTTLLGRIAWLFKQPITASERKEAEEFRKDIRNVLKQAHQLDQGKQAPA